MENEYDPIDMGSLKEVRDEEIMFVEKGYLKLPINFKLRHDIRTGQEAFKKGFPNPETTHMEDDEGYEYIVYRWKKEDLDAYDKTWKGGNDAVVMEEALEDARTKTVLTVPREPEQEVDTPDPAYAPMPLKGIDEKDISRMRLSEKENTKSNVEALHELAEQQKIREKKADTGMLPDLESRAIYFLKIVDNKFARQIPIDPQSLTDTVRGFGVMNDHEMGEVLDTLVTRGVADHMGDGRWFFKETTVLPPLVSEPQPEEVAEDEPEEKAEEEAQEKQGTDEEVVANIEEDRTEIKW